MPVYVSIKLVHQSPPSERVSALTGSSAHSLLQTDWLSGIKGSPVKRSAPVSGMYQDLRERDVSKHISVYHSRHYLNAEYMESSQLLNKTSFNFL